MTISLNGFGKKRKGKKGVKIESTYPRAHRIRHDVNLEIGHLAQRALERQVENDEVELCNRYERRIEGL